MSGTLEEQLEAQKKKYWHGRKNWWIRIYYYCRRGMDEINTFKNLIYGILGVCFFLKITNMFYMGSILACFMPVLAVIGYASVHHVAKPIEWLGIEFSSHWGRYNYTLNENQMNSLKEVVEELKKINRFLETK